MSSCKQLQFSLLMDFRADTMCTVSPSKTAREHKAFQEGKPLVTNISQTHDLPSQIGLSFVDFDNLVQNRIKSIGIRAFIKNRRRPNLSQTNSIKIDPT